MTMQPDTAETSPLFCNRCGAELQPGTGTFYQVTIAAVADPAPPMVTEEDLTGDVRAEIEKLIDQLSALSEREVLDQVHRRVVIFLCIPCYRPWIEDPTG